MTERSPLQDVRYGYVPKLPGAISGDLAGISMVSGGATEAVADQEAVRGLFRETYGAPVVRFEGTGKGLDAVGRRCTVGVILSGGQAPGGHNVIAGLFDALKRGNAESRLIGFRGGPSGILENDVLEITDSVIDAFRNTGGFDIIGSGRTKLESEEQFERALLTCREHGVDCIVIIGGDDSNTNGAVLAEWLKRRGTGISVIGCPKTIDGDLKNEFIETSFGFDTATKTYGELIGNIGRDANSARKYWHFIKLMGRSASHIALECALQTHPNVCVISEEVRERGLSLGQVVGGIADTVAARAGAGLNFGLVLIPEGLIEFIPEVGVLISELNDLLALEAGAFAGLGSEREQIDWVSGKLSDGSSGVFVSLPNDIQVQLLSDRDPHGNVQVSRIETEKLLIELVDVELEKRRSAGLFEGSFSALSHFFGYEGRCAFPSNFDADYCYSLGYCAFLLQAAGLTGYIANVSELQGGAADWVPGGVPLTMMMNMERRHGHDKPVIRKALVELDGRPFRVFAENREAWAAGSDFLSPGAIQYFGPPEVCDAGTLTLRLEKGQ